MNIISHQIQGKGRGKLLRYPTINLEIPQGITLGEGIWAAWVVIAGKKYRGALHFGPIPTFGEAEKSLEVFLLDTTEEQLIGIETKAIELVPVTWLREIISFTSTEALTDQIAKDVASVRAILLS